MFPSLNESIGWQNVDSILPNSTILLGDSGPIDSLPFIFSFMNFWLKSPTDPNSAIIFISFKSPLNRISSVFRKLYGIQLNLLAAQSRFAFINASSVEDFDHLSVLRELEEILRIRKEKNSKGRVLVLLEGFAWTIGNGIGSPKTFSSICTGINKLLETVASFDLLVQWSRDLEEDYPGRNRLLIEDIRLGGAGWLYLLSACHYVFCVRPLKSGMSRDASGEIVAALGPSMQLVKNQPIIIFHPTLSLLKVTNDTTFQTFTKGNL